MSPIVTATDHTKLFFFFFFSRFVAVCGGEIMVTDEQGHLESPNFPDDYLPNKECVWKLTAPEGYQVGFKFNVFEVCFNGKTLFSMTRIYF